MLKLHEISDTSDNAALFLLKEAKTGPDFRSVVIGENLWSSPYSAAIGATARALALADSPAISSLARAIGLLR